MSASIGSSEPKPSNVDEVTLNYIKSCCGNGYNFVNDGQHLVRGSKVDADFSSATDMGAQQVGGHKLSDGVKGMVLLQPNCILKPMQSRDRGKYEAAFYEEIEHQKTHNPSQLHGLDGFLSSYHGVASLGEDEGREDLIGGEYIVFTNITAYYQFPCVVDIKLGRRTYVENASESKKLKEIKKYPWQEEAGYRFVGSRTYEIAHGEYVNVDKTVYYVTPPEQFISVFQRFLGAGIPDQQTRIRTIQNIVTRLTQLITCFENQTQFSFTSASLLIAYDALAEVKEEAPFDLRFIDVTHVKPSEGPDTSTLFGLQQVAQTLTQLIEIETTSL